MNFYFIEFLIILISLCITVAVWIMLYKSVKKMDELFSAQRDLFLNGDCSDDSTKKSLDEILQDYEDKRDEDFNKRIKKMEEELYGGGVKAEILHPDIENLPHNKTDTITSKEEYAE